MINSNKYTKVITCSKNVLIALLFFVTGAQAKGKLPDISSVKDEYGNIDIIYITHADQRQNQIKFIETKILPQISSKNKFLEIGPGPGYITEKIAKHFAKTTVVEPIKDFEKSFIEHGYTTFIGNFQDIELQDSYNFIVCSHVLYDINGHEWGSFITKMYNLLEPNGKALIVIISPKGPWGELQKSINPDYPNSTQVERVLKKLGMPYQISYIKSSFKTSVREEFFKVFKRFTTGNCYPHEPKFDQLPAKQQAKVIKKIEKFVDDSKKADGNYVATWDDAYIVLSKDKTK